jgi:hypothetical protein
MRKIKKIGLVVSDFMLLGGFFLYNINFWREIYLLQDEMSLPFVIITALIGYMAIGFSILFGLLFIAEKF